MRDEVRELFKETIAFAIDSGKDIRLEWKNHNSSSKALGGSIIDSETIDDGLVLSVYQPSETEE